MMWCRQRKDLRLSQPINGTRITNIRWKTFRKTESQIHHRLEEDELACPNCGETMTEIGTEVDRTLEIIPAKTVVKEHIYYTYACRKCSKEGTETPIVKAPREKNIIPGSFATPEAIAHVMVQKFVMGSPLYRQEQELKRQGIPLSRQTMSNWILKASQDYLEPVYEQLHKELLKREVLHADETTLQVLHEPGKEPQSKSYMWLYRTSGDTNRAILMYEYQPSRGAVHPRGFLEGFKGYLHTTAMPDTTTFRKILLWLAAGHICGESLTRR